MYKKTIKRFPASHGWGEGFDDCLGAADVPRLHLRLDDAALLTHRVRRVTGVRLHPGLPRESEIPLQQEPSFYSHSHAFSLST